MNQGSNLYNLDAEEQILSAIFAEPELIEALTIDPDWFSPKKNGPLLKTMIDLNDKEIPIDPITIFERLGEKNVHRVGGISYLTELASAFISIRNFDYWMESVAEHYQKRESQKIGMLLAGGSMDPNEAMTQLGRILTPRDHHDDGSIKETLVEVYDEIESADGNLSGISLGYRDLDVITDGAQDDDLIIIAARPSVGKTAFALNVASNTVANHDRPDGAIVAFFSGEMGKKPLVKRLITTNGNLDSYAMKHATKRFTGKDWMKLTQVLGLLGNSDFRIFDQPGMDLNYIKTKTRKLRKDNPGRKILVMVDYLQLIVGDPKHKGNKQAEVGDISSGLKIMARENKTPVIALSQLSRGVEQRQDKRPMLGDLRESGQIEQDADVVAMLYREDYYDKETEDQNMIEVIIAKQRNGPTGTVKLAFVKEYGKFVTIDGTNHPD